MLEIKKVSPYLSVSSQISVSDVARLAERGFRAIINNRPEDEADDQPIGADIAVEAKRLGMVYCAVPVVAGQMEDADVQAFMHAQQTIEGPVLAFCRTGTRSIILWAMSQVGRLHIDSIVSTAKVAGYDLDNLRLTLKSKRRALLSGKKPVFSAGK